MFESVNTIEGTGWGTAMTDEGPVLYISIEGDAGVTVYVCMPIKAEHLKSAALDLENADKRSIH